MSFPDIAPVLGKGLLDEMLEDGLRGKKSPGHLSGWAAMVAKKNPAKNIFLAYERRFRLQHYWRVLHRYYSNSLQRCRRRLIVAFSEFLQVSEDTIKGDLREISLKLGSKWQHRFMDLN